MAKESMMEKIARIKRRTEKKFLATSKRKVEAQEEKELLNYFWEEEDGESYVPFWEENKGGV